MPILWRYLLKSFGKVFALTLISFLAILLVSRFQEIARFAATAGSGKEILFFFLYQMPAILPLAIPIASLMGALLLFSGMSTHCELLAFRASGLSLRELMAPFMILSLFLSLTSFTVVAKISPLCKQKSLELISSMSEKNPLFFLQKDTLIKTENFYAEAKRHRGSKKAEEVLLITKLPKSHRLSVVLADGVSFEGKKVRGKNLTFLSHPKNHEGGFDPTYLESVSSMEMGPGALSKYFGGKKERKESHDTLFSLRSRPEMVRRMMLALSPIPFTLLGLCFGCRIGRGRKLKEIGTPLLLASFFLATLVAARPLHNKPAIAIAVYLLPLFLLVGTSYYHLRKIEKGVE